MRILIAIACVLQVTCAAPQFVTFKDGKVGVNFGGYHASAGLGGLLTGNAAHGGLSASAGTPWGPQAAAGLNGAVDGRTAGVAYAGAQANPSVGASAVLGGSAGEHGFAGSEAHANGHVASKSLHTQSAAPVQPVTGAPAASDEQQYNTNAIQKIKPPKKYALIQNEQTENANTNAVHSKHLLKSVSKHYGPPPPPPHPAFHPLPPPQLAGGPSQTDVKLHYNGGVVSSALNIPIGILRSLQESLGGLAVDKSVSYTQSH